MTKIIIACVLVFLSVGTAGTSEKTDIMTVIHQWVDAFNRGDIKSSLAACADQSVVVDDTPPSCLATKPIASRSPTKSAIDDGSGT